MSVPHLPYRLTEAAFRRFEVVIAEAVHRYPTRVPVDPQAYGLRPSTCIARLRDALASLKNYHWTISFRESYDAIKDDFYVSERDGEITIGGPSAPTLSAIHPINAEAPIRCKPELVPMFAGIIHLFKGPVLIETDDRFWETEALENRFDVRIDVLENNQLLLS